MLAATAEFPQINSRAVHDGKLVTIYQRFGTVGAVVFGEGIQRRVSIDELSPAPEPSLFDRWRAERIVTGPHALPTPASQVAADYRAWLEDQGAARHDHPVSDFVFVRMMREAGHVPFTGYWRAPGDTLVRLRTLYPFTLAHSTPKPEAAPAKPRRQRKARGK